MSLYLSVNYVSIHETATGQKRVVAWKEVTSIKRRRCLARDNAISIHYTHENDDQGEQELFVYGISHRDEVAAVMDQLWQNTMSQLLRSAELNSLTEESSPTLQSARRDSGPKYASSSHAMALY